MELSEELLPGCVICGKQWMRKETDRYVYHDSKGVVCVRHEGVVEWHNDLVQKLVKELEELGCYGLE